MIQQKTSYFCMWLMKWLTHVDPSLCRVAASVIEYLNATYHKIMFDNEAFQFIGSKNLVWIINICLNIAFIIT